MTFTFASPVSQFGLLVENAFQGTGKANIKAFNGTTLLISEDPPYAVVNGGSTTFLGVNDSVEEITSIVIDTIPPARSAASSGYTYFGVVQLTDSAAAAALASPEPATLLLLTAALAACGRLRR